MLLADLPADHRGALRRAVQMLILYVVSCFQHFFCIPLPWKPRSCSDKIPRFQNQKKAMSNGLHLQVMSATERTKTARYNPFCR